MSEFKVPMPEFKLNVFHVSDGLELVPVKASQQPNAKPGEKELEKVMLRQRLDEVKDNICFLITTGAGSIVRSTKNELGEHVFPRQVLQLKKHRTLEGDFELCHVNLSMHTEVKERGIRPVGFADLMLVNLLKAACDGKTLKVKGQMLVPFEKSDTSPVTVVLTPQESNEWRASAKAWLDANKENVAMMTSWTVDRQQISKQLETFAKIREQRTYGIMRSNYGNLNDPVNINKVSLTADTNGYCVQACPQQANRMLLEFNSNPEMLRKNALMMTRSAIQSAAEVCASYQPIGAHGEQSIMTEDLIQFLQVNTKQLVGSRGVAAREKVYEDYMTNLHTAFTGEDVMKRGYMNDECYKWEKNTIKAQNGNSEKMDMAGGPSFMHYERMKEKFKQETSTKDELLREKTRLERGAGAVPNISANVKRMAGEVPKDALASVQNKLNEINQNIAETVNLYEYQPQDCEDGTMRVLIATNALQNYPDVLYEQMKPFVAKSLLPMENMFPSGKASTMFQTESSRVEAIHFIVKASLLLASEALKWQSKPVNGTTKSYKLCFGLASAASLNRDSVGKPIDKIPITREMCTSYEDYLVKLLQGVTLAGHCYGALAHETELHRYADGTKLNLAEIGWKDLKETTVANAIPGSKETKEEKDKRLGKKNLDISIGGQHLLLQNVSHSEAREAIGEVLLMKVQAKRGMEQRTVPLADMAKSVTFYDLFSQVGGAQSISAEITDEKNITSRLEAHAAADALISRSPNVNFCTSTIAWEGCPTPSHKTKAVTISVPIAAEEERLLKQIAYELTPMHAMTQDQLAFFMNDMGHVVNVGFENGVFHGNDFTGERLDSETRVAHFFMVDLTPLGRSLPKYWQNPAGVNALLQKEMQEVLPGLAVRVSQIETGMHVMQVVIGA